MAQTTGALPKSSFQVEVSTDGATWTDISGSASSVEEPEQARKSGEAFTALGDVAVIVSGKREPMEIVVNGVYTEETDEMFEVLRDIHEAGGAVYFRYASQGGATGAFQYTACGDAGTAIPVVLTNLKYPGFEADSGDVVMTSFTVKTPALAKAAIS